MHCRKRQTSDSNTPYEKAARTSNTAYSTTYCTIGKVLYNQGYVQQYIYETLRTLGTEDGNFSPERRKRTFECFVNPHIQYIR